MKIKLSIIRKWTEYLLSKTKKQRNKNIWVFGEWFGERCGDNCTYLANYIVNKYQDISVYWIAKKECDTAYLDSRIHVLTMGSEKADKIIFRAGVAVVNQSFGDITENGMNVFANAITVNLWHGIMWKKIGHDGDKRNGLLFKLYCKLLDPVQSTKFYVTPSENYGHHIISAFGVTKKAFIRAGLPRNRVFYDKELLEEYQNKIRKIIKASSTSRIITYMPTFRDTSSKSIDLAEIEDTQFLEFIEKENIYIIQKAHFVSQKRGINTNSSKRIINLNNVSAIELLAATDVLITDYSSCFFDYLILDKPIIHFIYDYDFYKNKDRGLYYDYQEVVAGKVAFNLSELCKLICEAVNNPDADHDRRKNIFNKFCTYENAESCKTIVETIRQKQGGKDAFI